MTIAILFIISLLLMAMGMPMLMLVRVILLMAAAAVFTHSNTPFRCRAVRLLPRMLRQAERRSQRGAPEP